MCFLFVNRNMSSKGVQTGKEETKRSDNKRLLWVVTGSVSLLLLIAVIINKVFCCIPLWLDILLSLLIALSASGVAGLLVAILVDTPQLVRNFKGMLTTALASNDYLEELPGEKLEVLRKKIVGLLHKDSSRVPPSFLQLDDELCRLIDSPYYEYLTESIVVGCKKKYADILKEDSVENDENKPIPGDFFKKDVLVEFQIKNPGPENSYIDAVIGLSKYMDLPMDCKLEQSYRFKSFEVTIDDGETYDIHDALLIERCQVSPGRVGSDPNTMTYDTIVRMSLNGDPDNKITEDTVKSIIDKGGKIKYETSSSDTKKDLVAHFKNNVRVRISYSQICPTADSHYTRRVKYSTKNYMLSYTCQNDYVLHGQILGTLIKQSDMSIIKNNDNNLTLICRNWLLPKNGAFIVMDDVVNNKTE